MRKIFAGLSGVLALAVVVQFFLAASGAFDTAPNEESFQPHRMLGYLIVLIALLVALFAAVARMPGRLIGLSGLVTGLVVLQSLIAAISKAFEDTGGGTTTAGKLIFGLHAVNGLAIMAATMTIVRQAREVPGSAAPAAPAASARQES